MIILLQSVTIQIRRLFWHTSCYKVRQSNFITKCDRLLLQSTSGIAKCDGLLLQSASGITKCDGLYYKVCQVLQSATVITKWDVTLVLQINSLKVLLILKQNFQKKEPLLAKLQRWWVMMGLFCTKKRFSSFVQMIFLFQKICFILKVLKIFKMFCHCHQKTYQSLKCRVTFKILIIIF